MTEPQSPATAHTYGLGLDGAFVARIQLLADVAHLLPLGYDGLADRAAVFGEIKHFEPPP